MKEDSIREHTAFLEPPFKVGDVVTRRNQRKLRGKYTVIGEVAPDPNPGSDGYNVILTHLGPYKIWPKDITEWTLVH